MESPLKPRLDGDCMTQIFPFQKYAQSSKTRLSCRYMGRTESWGKHTIQAQQQPRSEKPQARRAGPDSRGQPGCRHFLWASGAPAEGEASAHPTVHGYPGNDEIQCIHASDTALQNAPHKIPVTQYPFQIHNEEAQQHLSVVWCPVRKGRLSA